MVSDKEFKPNFFGDDEEPVQPEPESKTTEEPQEEELTEEISDDPQINQQHDDREAEENYSEHEFTANDEPEQKYEAAKPEEQLSFAEENMKLKKDNLSYVPEPEIPVENLSASIPDTATISDKAPIKDFLVLLLLIPVLPFYVIYLICKGKNKKFITSVIGTLLLVSGVSFIVYKQLEIIQSKQRKVINNLDEYLGENEVSPKEFEKGLKERVSTLAASIDGKTIPSELEPMLNIQQDMLTINYYHYLINAGYMGKNAEGAIYILQTALYSKNKDLSTAALKSLELINTAEANNIIRVYKASEPLQKPEAPKTNAPQGAPATNYDYEVNKLKYKMQQNGL